MYNKFGFFDIKEIQKVIYVGSHKNLRVVGVDPAPVRNPGEYINNKKMLVVVPNSGKGMLNSAARTSSGGLTYKFRPVGIPAGVFSDKTYGIPIIEVEAKIKEDGGLDKHSANIESTQEVIKKIHELIGRD